MIDNHAMATMRASRFELEATLRAHGVDMHGKECRCPFHDDNSASAGVYEKGGVWKFKCNAASCGWGGDIFDLIAKFEGKQVAEVLPMLRTQNDRSGPASPQDTQSPNDPGKYAVGHDARGVKVYASIDDLKRGVVAATNYKLGRNDVSLDAVTECNQYTDPTSGVCDLVTLRVEVPGEKKQFMQASLARRHEINADGFVLKKPPGKQPIFNRTRVSENEHVIVVEGEKCVRALTLSKTLPPGFAATTSPGGASKGRAEDTDWSPLASKKSVYVWADNDPEDDKGIRGGVEHMLAVIKQLEGLVPKPDVYWIEPTTLGLPPKGDAADFLDALEGRPDAERVDAIGVVLDRAEKLNPSRGVRTRIRRIISGEIAAVPWKWSGLSQATQALLPGSVTVMCGSAGSRKSWIALQSAWHWHNAGVRVAYFPLEKDREWHLMRLQAVIEDKIEMTEYGWIHDNPTIVTEALARCEPLMDAFSPCLTTEPENRVKHADAIDWLRGKASAGVRIAIIDPVTALLGEGSPWIEDLEFVLACRDIAMREEMSVILVTHPRKAGRATSSTKSQQMSDELAGGAAYARFTDCIIWPMAHLPKLSRCLVAGGASIPREHSVTVRICKANDGPGKGVELAYSLKPSSPLLDEMGMIDTEDGVSKPSESDAEIPA